MSVDVHSIPAQLLFCAQVLLVWEDYACDRTDKRYLLRLQLHAVTQLSRSTTAKCNVCHDCVWAVSSMLPAVCTLKSACDVQIFPQTASLLRSLNPFADGQQLSPGRTSDAGYSCQLLAPSCKVRGFIGRYHVPDSCSNGAAGGKKWGALCSIKCMKWTWMHTSHAKFKR